MQNYELQRLENIAQHVRIKKKKLMINAVRNIYINDVFYNINGHCNFFDFLLREIDLKI